MLIILRAFGKKKWNKTAGNYVFQTFLAEKIENKHGKPQTSTAVDLK